MTLRHPGTVVFFLGFVLLMCGVADGHCKSDTSVGYLSLGYSGVSKSNILGIDRERPGSLPTGFASGEPDTLRVLALRVEFQPDDDPETTGDGTFDLSASSEVEIDPPPHDYDYFERHLRSLKNYYDGVSHGKLILTYDLYPHEPDGSFRLPAFMADYTSGATDAENDSLLAVFFRDALQLADGSDPELTFSSYHSFLVFHPGAGRESDLQRDSQKDIPSAFYNFDDFKRYLGDKNPEYQGIPVKDGFVREGLWLPETESQDGFEFGLNGMAAHQFGYQLGLPSLFNTHSGRSAIGRWGLMDQGFDNESGVVPAQPCIWSKVFLGWVEPYQVRSKGEDLEVAAWALKSGSVEAVKINVTPSEYFLIENRQRDVNGDDAVVETVEEGVTVAVDEYDWGIPGSGLLIWHIDEEVIAANYVDNKINTDPDHRGVDLEEADGVQEIGTSYGYIYGQKDDAYYDGNSAWVEANPLLEHISFTPTSNPNSRSHSGANSFIHVTDISASDPVMSLRVSIDTYQDGWPQFVGSTVGTNSPVFGDLNNDGDIEVVFTSEEGKVFVWNHDGSKFLSNADSVFSVGPKGDTTWVQAAVFAETGGKIIGNPAIGDLDGDTDMEIVTSSDDGKLYGWHHGDADSDGKADGLQGYPFNPQSFFCPPIIVYFAELEMFTPTPEIVFCTENGDVFVLNIEQMVSEPLIRFPDESFHKSPAASDIIGNEEIELVLVSQRGTVIMIDENGEVFWSTDFEASPASSPVIGDINRDGEGEILVVGDDGRIWVFDADGLTVPGWPVDIEGALESTPALGDIDNDGYLEVVLSGVNKIYAFNYNGSALPNWPVTVDRTDPVGILKSSPVIGDIDGDNDLEVLVGSPGGLLLAYHHNGSVVDGFPLACGGEVNATPALLDVDGDGDIEVMVGADDGYLYMWDLPGTYNNENIPWPMFAHDAQHTGAYPSFHLPPDIPEEELLSETSVYNFPNPTEGNSTLIRYRLGEEATVRIKIFNLAGELVDEFSGPGDTHTENEITWDITDFASGVYICRVEASGSQGTKTAFCKIAVAK